MKLLRLTLTVLAFLCGLQAVHSQILLISPFGNNATPDGGWTYDPATGILSTPSEGFADSLFGTSQTMDLGTDRYVQLSANATTAPAGAAFFTITLTDASADDASATFVWSGFTGGATIKQALSYTTFDFAHVTSWTLSSGGSNAPLNITLTNLSAAPVPEPSTCMLLFAGLFALWAIDRHRHACKSLTLVAIRR